MIRTSRCFGREDVLNVQSDINGICNLHFFCLHYPNAYDAIFSYSKLFSELEGVASYITPPPPAVMPWWLNEEKEKYTRTFFGQYPPPHKQGW